MSIYYKYTKIIVFMLWFFGSNLLYSQGNSAFNTIKKELRLGKVSTWLKSEADSLVIDSLNVAMPGKKEIAFLPMDTVIITSEYGYRIHPISGTRKFHGGVDIRANDEFVYSVQSGVVTRVGYNKVLGSYIKVLCGNYEFIYGHLSHVYVKEGWRADVGLPIGRSGGTGDVTASHLHFEVLHNGKNIDPFPLLEFIGNTAE